MHWKIIKRTFLTLFLLATACIGLLIGLVVYSALFGLKTTDCDITSYEKYRKDMLYADGFMPSLDSLGAYKDIAFGQTEVLYIPFFISASMNLFVHYDADDYAAVKAQALDGRRMLTAPVYYRDGALVCLPSVSYRGYELHTIMLEADDYYSCKYVGFIGFDDAHHAVCYLLYNDDDRDIIGQPGKDPVKEMQAWLKKEFWWHTFQD